MTGRRQRALVPALMAMALVVSIISSLGAPLVPEIARALGVGVPAAQWSLTATMLAGAVAAPVVGRLGDGPQRRLVLVVCLVGVSAGGVLAALATTLGPLLAGRALQGLGLAMLPLLMATARDHLPADRAHRAIAGLSVIGAAGIGLGYPITGFISEHAGPSAAFWFGAAGSAAALAAGLYAVPRSRPDTDPVRVDVPGAALVGLGLVALLLGVERGAVEGWASGPTLGLLLAAALLLSAWTRWQLAAAEPLVDLRQLRHHGVRTANATSLLLGAAMYLVISLTTQVVQVDVGLGRTVLVAGLVLVPFSVASAVGSALLGPLRRRAGDQASIPIGALLVGAGALLFAVTGDRLVDALATMALLGLGLGLTFAAMPALIVADVPAEETSSAMSLYQVTRYVGFAIGSALAATLLRIFSDAGAVTAGSFSRAYVVAAVLGLLAAAIAWALGRRRRDHRTAARPVRDAPAGTLA